MSLTGVWLNEQSSILVLVDPGDGMLHGKFRSLVGRDSQPRELAGRTGGEEQSRQLLGFSVCFHIDDPAPGNGHSSICTWSGWARGNRITTHWLLTSSLLRPQDDWSSTRTGKDCFERILNTPDETQLKASSEDLARLLSKSRG